LALISEGNLLVPLDPLHWSALRADERFALALGREGFEPSTLGLREPPIRLGLSRLIWVLRENRHRVGA